MPAPIATSLATILPYVQAQLASVTGVPLTNVMLARAGRHRPHFSGLQDIIIQPLPPAPESGFELGSGRVAAVFNRVLAVTGRTGMSVDMSDRDDYWLLAAGGQLALEEAILNALHIWVPVDTNGNWLTQSPLQWVPSDLPKKDTELPDSQDWGESTMHFSLQYQLAVTDNTF
jgi:hypothetical protein